MVLLQNVFLMLITLVLISGCDNSPKSSSSSTGVRQLDLTEYSATTPSQPLNLLFIHHSCGATLFADPGEKAGEYCLYDTHPNGGGLRNMLRQNNYNVHEATYGSKLGQKTNINHWHAKFRDQMDLALKTRLQDELLEGDEVNQLIVFKSCFPNNNFVDDGTPPGDPDSGERTMWNAKAAYNSLLPIFEKYPDTLFVAVTAPPLVKPWVSKYKGMVLNLLGKGPGKTGERARNFNNWLIDSKSGWLAGYDLNNIVVFDLYNVLTGGGKSNWAQYPTRDGKNSHPSSVGNTVAAKEFIPFINRAVRYSAISEN